MQNARRSGNPLPRHLIEIHRIADEVPRLEYVEGLMELAVGMTVSRPDLGRVYSLTLARILEEVLKLYGNAADAPQRAASASFLERNYRTLVLMDNSSFAGPSLMLSASRSLQLSLPDGIRRQPTVRKMQSDFDLIESQWTQGISKLQDDCEVLDVLADWMVVPLWQAQNFTTADTWDLRRELGARSARMLGDGITAAMKNNFCRRNAQPRLDALGAQLADHVTEWTNREWDRALEDDDVTGKRQALRAMDLFLQQFLQGPMSPLPIAAQPLVHAYQAQVLTMLCEDGPAAIHIADAGGDLETDYVDKLRADRECP